MSQKINETQLNLALQAIRKTPNLSTRRAAKIYQVGHRRLGERLRGIPPRRDISANSRRLTDLQESVLSEYILELDSKGFPPRLCVVEDMANRILATRQDERVGQRWAGNFVRRRPELRTRFQRKYDYQRAKCEDPAVVRAWFELVRNTIAKYAIVDADIYNFDETGFMMGVISTGMVVTSSDGRKQAKKTQPGNREWVTVVQAVNSVGYAIPPFLVVAGKNHLESWYNEVDFPPEWRAGVTSNGWTTNEMAMEWIRHFEEFTTPRKLGVYRLLVLDGHESHHSIDFEEYCKKHNIVTLCMPPHSSHLLQPLDVGCFSPLKKAYGRQIEELMRQQITHITKEDFIPAFRAAFQDSLTENNIQGGFRGSGLVPFDPERVISTLDLKLRTPTPQNSRPSTADPWTSLTPHNPTQTTSQTSFIKERVTRHQGSSPTAILDAVESLSKGTSKVMYQLALLRAENQQLRKANETLSKRRRRTKRRLQEGGSLNLQEAQAIMDDRDVADQLKQETWSGGGRQPRTETRARRCGNCNETGHNSRTCPIVIETSEEENSE
jgi:DDE superfamily endonuclease/Tc5 transposase DNA-binding domain/helix-turn-helix, Psq domain